MIGNETKKNICTEEYGWSNITKEKILQFSYQLTRTNDENKMKNLEDILREILQNLKKSREIINNNEELSILYKLIGHTRDIVDGKGEYMLAYMQILVWYDFFPELSKFALKSLVSSSQIKSVDQPYGSWKDIKYFCNYCRKKTQNSNHELIKYAIQITISQLETDIITKNI